MQRAKELAHGLINCMGRRTVTGLLIGCGMLFEDWSANYRLFQKDRMNLDSLFSVVRQEVISRLNTTEPIRAHMDDTLLRKTGKKVPGTAWRRDPLGPPFHTNFVWGQRFIQLSISLPDHDGICAAKSIPVDFHHAPSAKKPSGQADQAAIKEYRQAQKQTKLSRQGALRIQQLRKNLDQDGAQHRQLIMSVDGSYTNETVLKNLPEKTTLIGRIRKDTALHQLPNPNEKPGRKRIYGEQLPTPEQIRQSDQYKWQQVAAYAAGKQHIFNVKVVKAIRWKKAGEQLLQLVIIRPLSYRLTKQSRLLYRKPAYLICTDAELAIETLLQSYLWRWGIEVNFREEKTTLGCGEAQVRNNTAVVKVPGFITAIYAMMLLAANQIEQLKTEQLPHTKWYTKRKDNKLTTGDIINQIRTQIYVDTININFDHFVKIYKNTRSHLNRANMLLSAAFYCRK